MISRNASSGTYPRAVAAVVLVVAFGTLAAAALARGKPAAAPPPAVDAGAARDLPRDAGPSDAKPTDAPPIVDASSEAVAARVRAEEARAEAARIAAERAAAAKAAAAKAAETVSEAELGRRVLNRERAELNDEYARLKAFADEVNAGHAEVERLRKVIEADYLPRPLPSSAAARDARFDEIARELDQVLHAGLAATERLFSGARVPPRMPDALSEAALKLPESFRLEVEKLDAGRKRQVERAVQLAKFAEQLLADRVQVLRERALQLNRMRVDLLDEVSAAKRRELTGLSRQHLEMLHTELLMVRLELTYWAHKRLEQLRHVPATATNLSAAGSFAWKLLEVLLLLMLLRWAFASWDGWMQAVIAYMGRGLHLSGWTLTFARLAELARRFGPAGLVLLASGTLYARLGGETSPAEVQVLYIIVFWAALLRMQLRFVQALAQNIGTRLMERERQRRELELVDSLETDAEAGEVGAEKAREPAKDRSATEKRVPVWDLVDRTWTILTRYAALFIIADALIEFAVGPGFVYRALAQIAWWGLVPLGVILLLLWRDHIVATYQKRATGSAMCRFTERHADRIYGPVVVLIALFILIGLRIASFVKHHLSNLNSTKRVLAFLFRRRVEKHAKERGHVLLEPHQLPDRLAQQFSTEPLSAAERPVKPAFLADIKAQFTRWTQTQNEGSIALVGASGMGKTTVLRLLEAELGEPVMLGRIMTKVTGVEQMVGIVARAIGLAGQPTSVAEIIGMLRDEQRRVIALDDCHNLFLRRIGGFEAWEAFTHIVNESCDNVFWVCSFNGHSWEYLNDISDRVSYFREVIMMPPWTDQAIRRMILTRTRRARFKPNFTDLLVSRVEGVNMSTQIIGTAHGYFRLLWDFTSGNPRLACHFWLRSLVPDEEKSAVRVHLFASPSVTALEALSDDMSFVLAALVEHENVTASEVAIICNMPLEFCRFALRYLREQGYLYRDATSGRSYLSYHWQQTVIRFLKRKHLLYS